MIFHEGRSKLSGHYRAALCSGGCIKYITNDGTEAIPASPADCTLVEEHSYIFFFTQC